MKKLLFYDIEVFKYDNLAVFMDEDNNFTEFTNKTGYDKVKNFIKGKTLVGYNNYFYDDIVLSNLMSGLKPTAIKEMNDNIIHSDTPKKYYLSPFIVSLDCMQQIDVSRPSLKKIQGNLGKAIVESEIPFNIDRPLTDEEINDVMAYCRNDVITTQIIYKMRENNYFKSKQRLLDAGGNEKARKWNTTTLSVDFLSNSAKTEYQENKPKLLVSQWSTIRIAPEILAKAPEEAQELWKNINIVKKPKSCTVTQCGNNIVFGSGGLHGEPGKPIKANNVYLLDAVSMYPNIILTLDVLGKYSKKYSEIIEERVKAKNTDPELSQALKIVVNSIYGNLKNKYSRLYNPQSCLSVCVYGQIALYDLCVKLHSKGANIININTDGVAFCADGEEFREVLPQWEEDWKLKLEESYFERWIQKDVNNYIAKHGDEIKAVGGLYNLYNKDNYFSNNNARIIHKAVVDHLVHGADLIDTIRKNTDKPELYQYILKAGGTYLGTCNEQGELQKQAVNRVFATDKGETELMKLRPDGGKVKFADAPARMYVHNGDCKDLTNFAEIVDIDHYYKIARKKVDQSL